MTKTRSLQRPVRRGWEPASAYLILAHGYVMLRRGETIQWTPVESANKFELLVTSSRDRIFGQLVQAQQAEERKRKELAYRERKLAEKKKREQDLKKGILKEDEMDNHQRNKQKLNANDQRPGDHVDNNEGEGQGRVRPPRVALLDDDMVEIGDPGTPMSNMKVHNGEEVKATNPIIAAARPDGRAVIAVPIKHDKDGEAADQKHEVEAVAALPPIPQEQDEKVDKEDTKGGDKPEENAQKPRNKDDKPGGKDDKPRAKMTMDPTRDAEMLAAMVQAAAGRAGPDGPIGLEDIKIAFKALERAAKGSMTGPNDDKDLKNEGPLIWTWRDSCERWRWRTFEAKVHEILPGGWEERDWKVFADGRGCEEFDEHMEVMEIREEDIHDWSC